MPCAEALLFISGRRFSLSSQATISPRSSISSAAERLFVPGAAQASSSLSPGRAPSVHAASCAASSSTKAVGSSPSRHSGMPPPYILMPHGEAAVGSASKPCPCSSASSDSRLRRRVFTLSVSGAGCEKASSIARVRSAPYARTSSRQSGSGTEKRTESEFISFSPSLPSGSGKGASSVLLWYSRRIAFTNPRDEGRASATVSFTAACGGMRSQKAS